MPVFLMALAVAAQIPAPDAAARLSEELHKARTEIIARETSAVDALADRLKAAGDGTAADEVKAAIASPAPHGCATRFVPLPEVVPAKASESGLANVPLKPAAPGGSRTELSVIRKQSAGELFALAGRAVAKNPKHYALADLCLREVLDRDPDHKEARRLLGYVPYKGGWATPYAKAQFSRGKVFHPPYGWVPASWVPHLEKGELPAPPLEPRQREPRWVTAAEADRLHGDWNHAWEISTEHFKIITNVPLAEVIAFGKQLEDFHELFYSLLADVFGDTLPLARRFRDKGATGETITDEHTVHYYATKHEYIDALVPLEGPDIARSLGIYRPPQQAKQKRGIAYFYRDDKGDLQVTATLYHEVSHQLLLESGLGAARQFERNNGNHWVFEGMGTYFETLEVHKDGSIEVGGLVGRRIEEAVKRLAIQNEHIPLAQFVRYDQKALMNGDPFLKYQEACALAVFFMQYDNERYREEFLDYVRDAARGRLRGPNAKSLEERVGESYKTLDDQFLRFLKHGVAGLKQ